MNFGTFAKYVVPAAQENVFALLNISHFGVQGHPEIPPYLGDLHDAAHFDVPSALRCIREYSHIIVGAKVRLTASLADNDADKERAGLRAALQLRDESGLPLMVHHVMSSIPLAELLAQLRAGDILTHFITATATADLQQTARPAKPCWTRADAELSSMSGMASVLFRGKLPKRPAPSIISGRTRLAATCTFLTCKRQSSICRRR